MNTTPAVGEIYARIWNPECARYRYDQFLQTKAGKAYQNRISNDPKFWGPDGGGDVELQRMLRQFGYENLRVQCWTDGVAMVADPRGVLVPAYSLPGFESVIDADLPRFRAAA